MDQLRPPVERLSFDMFTAASDLLHERGQDDKNFVVGAFSAAAAAALIYVGSEGTTADRLKRIMRFERLFENRCTPQLIMIAFRQAVAHITKRPDQHFPLDDQSKQSAFQVVLASKVFFRVGNAIRSELYNNAKHVFNNDIAEMEDIKDGTTLDELRKNINQWVKKNTDGEFAELLAPIDLQDVDDDLTRMFLLNVTFMRARWNESFMFSDVTEGIFTNVHGKQLAVPMMQGIKHLVYSEDTVHRVKYIELPYANNEASLCLMCPTPYRGRRRTIKEMLRNFESDTFARIAVKKKLRKVNFKMPRFKVDNTLDLKDIFQRIGMMAALEGVSSAATGSSVMDNSGFSLIGAFHKCSMEVNEFGSSADSFSRKPSEKSEVPESSNDIRHNRVSSISEIVQFHADHPFIFSVRHNLSGLILFVGRVADFPSAPSVSSSATRSSSASKTSETIRNFFSRQLSGGKFPSLAPTKSAPK
ncbi:leukocyte elastase inhibitor A-like [Paramacrobiotus metropolitanus]|uniref:leukocyte elastase inhibitor A-like n=1 Tax=Paramacrobiotus metropolitanus TaxID=2943436 RepID=UPI002445623D|nr:leukocyte elastase inhibitor A-like [Paramacrobiotus metropolitanus]